MATMTEFGARLDEAQRERGVSNRELARMLKAQDSRVHTLKHKCARPQAATLAKIAKALDKPEEYFLAPGPMVPAAKKTILRKAPQNAETKLAAAAQALVSAEPAVGEWFEGAMLTTYVTFELAGRVVAKKRIQRLPDGFEF
jgi:transcriptional regulator with XRE-family HTH domain